MRYRESFIRLSEEQATLFRNRYGLASLPTDREELIEAYMMRFVSLALEEYSEYREIATIEEIERLIDKYDLRSRAEATKGSIEERKRLLYDTYRNSDLQEDLQESILALAEREAITFVCAKRQRLRSKALLLMGEEELNERERKYLNFEGDFWYNGEEDSLC